MVLLSSFLTGKPGLYSKHNLSHCCYLAQNASTLQLFPPQEYLPFPSSSIYLSQSLLINGKSRQMIFLKSFPCVLRHKEILLPFSIFFSMLPGSCLLHSRVPDPRLTIKYITCDVGDGMVTLTLILGKELIHCAVRRTLGV